MIQVSKRNHDINVQCLYDSYTPLYEKDTKQMQNRSMETTIFYQTTSKQPLILSILLKFLDDTSSKIKKHPFQNICQMPPKNAPFY